MGVQYKRSDGACLMLGVVCQADISNRRLTPAMNVVPVWRRGFAIEQKTIFFGDGFDEEVEYFLDIVD